MKSRIPIDEMFPELARQRREHLKPHGDEAGVVASAIFAVFFFPAIVALIFILFGAGSN